MNRGSSMADSTNRNRCTPRFNEAPIHESGKSRSPGMPGGPSDRFNEAPIHESGKCIGHLALSFPVSALQ